MLRKLLTLTPRYLQYSGTLPRISQRWEVLLVLRVLQGVGAAVTFPAMTAMWARYVILPLSLRQVLYMSISLSPHLLISSYPNSSSPCLLISSYPRLLISSSLGLLISLSPHLLNSSDGPHVMRSLPSVPSQTLVTLLVQHWLMQ